MLIDKQDTPLPGLGHVLQAKLTRPLRDEGVVARPQLVARLQDGLSRRLTLVAAPPGYGKTTAVALWLCETDRPNAWLSLDALDNDIRLFTTYLLAAITTVYPDAGEQTAALLESPQPAPPSAIADALIEDLAVLPGLLLLALDDYYLITDEEIEDLMERLVRYLPSNIHLVLISRTDPALPVSRMRARGELSEVRSVDLRFAADEARELLSHLTGAALDDQATTLLDEQTEGWAIGLQLVALAMRRGETLESLNEHISHEGYRHVTDYLIEEVLNKQPQPVREFLVRTSILERLNGSLCEAITGQQQAGETLHQAWRENLFVIPLGEQLDWFRYHHLFRDMLYRRLEAEESPATLRKLHHRAFHWLADHGFISQAIGHALAAGEADAAVRLIDANVHQALNREEWWRVNSWLGLMPSELRNRPELLVARSWSLLFQLRVPAMIQTLAEIDRQLEAMSSSRPAEAARLQTQTEAMRAAAAYWSGDPRTAMTMGAQAMAHLDPSMAYGRSISILYYAAGRHALGESTEARAYLRNRLETQSERSDIFVARLLIAQCLVYFESGDLGGLLHKAETLGRVAARARLTVSEAWSDFCKGIIAYEWNELEQAEQHLRKVIRTPHQVNGRAACDSFIVLTLALEAAGRPAAAQRVFEQFHAYLLDSDNLSALSLVEALQLYLRAGRNEPLPPLPPSETLNERAARTDLKVSFVLVPNVARARYLFRAGDPTRLPEARAHLAASRAAAEALHEDWRLAAILALEAVICDALGERDAALAILDRGLSLCPNGRLTRTYLDCGPALIPLLEELGRSGRHAAAGARLLSTFGAAPATIERPRPDLDPLMALRASLTHREMDVLTLLDLRLSNQEIAERLIVEPDTVKKHLHNLYRKLGVGNRREAVSYAYHIGLIVPQGR